MEWREFIGAERRPEGLRECALDDRMSPGGSKFGSVGRCRPPISGIAVGPLEIGHTSP
jgi:hypothetical protein